MGGHHRQRVRQLADVELVVGVGVEDEVGLGPAEAGAQRGRVALVDVVAEVAHARVVLPG